MFKFIHTADIHLDSPLRGLEVYDGAPVDEIRKASRRALENLVRLAIDEKVDAILIAGDLYDGDWRDYNTGLFFVKQMADLRQAGIKVFVIGGNHDAANKMTRRLRLPDNVHFFGHRRAETVRWDEHELSIHGQSYAREAVTDDLAASYPAAIPGWINIGLLHTSAGCVGHDPYAPCSAALLSNRGYDYWALGHVHCRTTLGTTPYIEFPGNLQGRHIRETGAKGCLLVTVDDKRNISIEFKPVDVFRWSRCPVDIADASTLEDVLDLLESPIECACRDNDDLPLGMRIALNGNPRALRAFTAHPDDWINEIRGLAIDRSGGRIWVEKVMIDSRNEDAAAEAAPSDLIGGLLERIQGMIANDRDLEDIQSGMARLREKLPADLKDGTEGIDLGDIGVIRQLAAEASQLLAGRLVNHGRGE